MLEARFDRAAVRLRAAVSWILFGDFSAPIPVEPRAPWNPTPSDVPTDQAHQAQEQLLVTLRDGDLHATGRYSDTPTPRWESSGRRWMMHSGRHTQILSEHWRGGQYSWNYGSLDLPDGQYIEIQVPRYMIVAIWPPRPEPEVAPRTSAGSSAAYTTPYLDLMRRAIDELRISAVSQPKKETVVAWLREQTADRQAISDNFARHLATFVRLPESQRGGNRKWRVAEED
jgi:hypothetical protein